MTVSVLEIQTTAGLMYEPLCSEHGAMPATFDQNAAVGWAMVHAARRDGQPQDEVPVAYLPVTAPRGVLT